MTAKLLGSQKVKSNRDPLPLAAEEKKPHVLTFGAGGGGRGGGLSSLEIHRSDKSVGFQNKPADTKIQVKHLVHHEVVLRPCTTSFVSTVPANSHSNAL